MTLVTQFKAYLQKQNLSPASVSNYVADINVFLRWIKEFVQGSTLESPRLNLKENFPPSLFRSYCQHLIDSNTPLTTANRYLASLRRFGEFLKESGLAKQNPAKDLENYQLSAISYQQILPDFEKALLKEKLTPATVKNYLADIRQFLEWLGKNYA